MEVAASVTNISLSNLSSSRKLKFPPSLPLEVCLLLLKINWGSPLLITLSVKSHSDFPKLRLVNLFYALYAFSCPIQHVPAESARSAGEISKAREVIIVYTPAVIVYTLVPFRVRLIGGVSLWPCQLV